MKKLDIEKGRELLYKSFELSPLPKMAVEVGEKATIQILEILEYLGSLTIARSLAFLGRDVMVTPMDKDTALFVRDHSVYSSVRRIADRGTAHQYGHTLLEGGHAPESLVGVASAIALVQENEYGEIQITRKKSIGLDNKHAKDLIPEFHDINTASKEKVQPIVEDHDVAFMKKITEESKPVLIKEEIPLLIGEEELPKPKRVVTAGGYRLPW